jgi:para-aminobenzoate synthetase component 1
MTGALPRPLVTTLPGWRDPLDVLPLFARDRAPALLLSAGPAGADPDLARFSFLCADPFAIVRWDAWCDEADPFVLLESTLAPHARAGADPWPFAGGAVGWIGYDARLAVEPVLRPTARRRGAGDPDLPDLWFGLYGWTIAWDHVAGSWAILTTGAPETGDRSAARARDDAARLRDRLESAPPATPLDVAERPEPAPIRGSSLSRDDYLALVESVRDLIAQGEVYQVNVAQRLRLDPPRDPMALMRALRRHSPAPFSAWIDTGEAQVACASPERFVSLRGPRAETRPIKGTAPRGATAAEDERRRADLQASEKDRAENVMIVDLERNDLGRVCRPGSVRVEALCRLETYASVHHLVSIVSGELDRGRGRADLLRAIFPGGSMTGAPKVRALRAIDELEPAPRGIYAGALGYLSLCGGMDLNIVIRSVVLASGQAWLHAGGGIVIDSDPAAEYEETLHKARSIRCALGAVGG